MPRPRSLVQLRRRLFEYRLGRGSGAAFAETTYSQEGEDRILLRIFDGQVRGFYVDVGAHHPTRFSNTYLLYRLGWHGLAIEPQPQMVKAHARIRPRDLALGIGLASVPGELIYHEFDETALNTFSKERAEQLEAETPYRLTRRTVVRVDRLDNVLRAHVPIGTEIDLLCVDAEGLDREILETNDWAVFRPRIVVAEILSVKSIDELAAAPLSMDLRENGYVPIAKTVNSVFFGRSPNELSVSTDKRRPDDQTA